MNATSKVVFGEFTGNYAEQQKAIFDQVKKYLGLVESVAHQFCLNWSTDIGRATKGAGITISIGKLKKNREAGRDIKGQLKTKGAQTTAVIDIADLLVRWEDLSSYGLHLAESKLVLREDWQTYLDSLSKTPGTSDVPNLLAEVKELVSK